MPQYIRCVNACSDLSYGTNNCQPQQPPHRAYNYGGIADNDGITRGRRSPQTLPMHHSVPTSSRGQASRQPAAVNRNSESCSSLSSVGSGSSSGADVDAGVSRHRNVADRLAVTATAGDADTLNSSGGGTTAGEDVYSRIPDVGQFYQRAQLNRCLCRIQALQCTDLLRLPSSPGSSSLTSNRSLRSRSTKHVLLPESVNLYLS
jgi:hypothetical protein